MHADVVPLGGFSVTHDISLGLAAPLSAAERIKTLFGAALGDLEAGADVISVPQMGEEGDDSALRVPRTMLTRIIQARLTEIFEEVQKRLQASGYDAVAGRRAVLTGGACQLTGTRELAARILNKQVRIGRPQAFPGLAAASAGPDYATAIGLLMAGRAVAARDFQSRNGRLTGGREGQKLALPVDRPVAGVIQQYNSESVGQFWCAQGDPIKSLRRI